MPLSEDAARWGRSSWSRFVGRGLAMSLVALPLAFALGYAAGGLTAAVGASAMAAGCVVIAGMIFARRYLFPGR
jgi:hypothetical protein